MGTELLVDALHMKPRTKPRGHWALELPSNPRDYREQMLQYKVLWRYGVQFYGIIDCNFKYTWHGRGIVWGTILRYHRLQFQVHMAWTRHCMGYNSTVSSTAISSIHGMDYAP
jgi:hypothetical protein